MNFKLRSLSLTLFLTLCSTVAAINERESNAEAVVVRFYRFLDTPAGRLITKDNTTLFSYFSSEVSRSLHTALAADENYLKKYPTDKPFFGDGTCIIYGGSECSFNSFRIIKTVSTMHQATVRVELSYADPRAPQSVTQWENTVYLHHENGQWRIVDMVRFKEKFTETLKTIVDEAQR